MDFKALSGLAFDHASNFTFYLSSLCSFYPSHSALSLFQNKKSSLYHGLCNDCFLCLESFPLRYLPNTLFHSDSVQRSFLKEAVAYHISKVTPSFLLNGLFLLNFSLITFITHWLKPKCMFVYPFVSLPYTTGSIRSRTFFIHYCILSPPTVPFT